jgi:hypothetical protein
MHPIYRPINIVAAMIIAGGLLCAGTGRAVSQRDDERKQTLIVHYPNPMIMINKTTRYNGMIYVKVYAVGTTPGKKNGPVATAELSPSMRDVMQLPLGEYEVHYAMRTGSELHTFILKDVILRAERGTALSVEMNSDAKTTIIGGDMSAQQMADGVRESMREIASLRAELAAVKRK